MFGGVEKKLMEHNITENIFANIKIVELARILAGPWAGQILADLGAQVIKIESPEGDDTRKWGPPFIDNNSAYFYSCNRGKKSVVIDFNNKEHYRKLIKIIKNADVIIENFKVDGLVKYQLDYKSIKKINPKIIYCSITGFGQDGPYANKPGYDFIIQAISGIMSITGEKNHRPQKIPVAFADIFAGLYSVIAIQAALWKRTSTKKGQFIDISLLDCMTAALANQAMNFLATGKTPEKIGNKHPNIAPYQSFQTKDAEIVITAGNDRQFQQLCHILDLKNLPLDPRFKVNHKRVENINQLEKLLQAKIKLFNAKQILQKLEKVKVPAAKINDIQELFNDPQMQFRKMKINPQKIPALRTPIIFSDAKLVLDKTAPELGDCNQEFE